MSKLSQLLVKNEKEMLAFAHELVEQFSPGSSVYLSGDLGTGKTFLTRALLNRLGHTGKVLSPTYGLVQEYQCHLKSQPIDVYHFDLYRLTDPQELEMIGFRDYFNDSSLCIIEWPEMGEGILPTASIHIQLELVSSDLPEARSIKITQNPRE